MPSFLPHQQHHYKDHHRCRDEHHGDDDEKVSVIAASTYGGFLLDLDQFPEWANATQCPEKWRHCKKCQTVKIMILNNAQSILNRQDSTVELRIKCMNIEEAIFVCSFLLKSCCCRVVYLFVCLSVCFSCLLYFCLFFFRNLGAVELCIVWDLLSSPGRRRRPPPSEGERHQITNWSLTTKKQNGRINIFTRLEFWSQALPEPVTALVFSNGHFETSSDIYWSTAFGHDILVDKDRYSGHNGWNVICRFLHILHSSQLDLGAMFSGKEFGPRSCFDL